MQALSTVMDRLNPQQREAVLHDEGPLLLVAGPGSGKTRVVTVRAARLFEEGVCTPDELTCVTFTNKAAGEMRHRLRELVGSAAGGAHLQTFHALCLRHLRTYSSYLPDGFDARFTVYDEKDTNRLLRQLRKSYETLFRGLELGEVSGRIDWWKTRGVSPEEVRGKTALGDIYAEYQDRLRAANSMDFGDLLFYCVRLLDEHPKVLGRCRAEARFLMVDEYQDTNSIQYRLVLQLADHGPRSVVVVGDPDQSIYAFRGADIRNILSFTADFEGCRTITLERNYRSTRTILAATNALISNNEERIDKTMTTDLEFDEPVFCAWSHTLTDELDRLAFLVRQELDRGVEPRDVAVISRTRRYVSRAEETLRDARIPCEAVGAVGFYERAEVRDVLAYVRVLFNPRDDAALLRIVNVPPRGIGAKTIKTILGVREPGECVLEAAQRAVDEGYLRTRARNAVSALIDLLWDVTSIPRDSAPAYFFENMLTRFGYKEVLDRAGDDDKVDRVTSLRDRMMRRDPQTGNVWDAVGTFLDSVATDTSTESGGGNRVQIMTAHSSKGLEFPTVFLGELVEDVLPHAYAIEADEVEEERRLAFVAMTRAMRRLYLCFHRSAWNHQREEVVERQHSRFLEEIPRELLASAKSAPVPASPLLNRFVTHRRFGRGLVVDQQSAGGDQLYLVVNFLDAGRRTVVPDSVSEVA